MSAIQYIGISNRDKAKRRFPRTPDQYIRGNGAFALVTKCGVPWRIFLFDTAAQRQSTLHDWNMGRCPRLRCLGDHLCVDL